MTTALVLGILCSNLSGWIFGRCYERYLWIKRIKHLRGEGDLK